MAPWSVTTAIAAVVASAGLIVVIGPRLARVADGLADRTGLGEAVVGAVLLGGATSLSGLVTTAVGAADGDGGFAMSNALGGIAVQTSFIPIADLVVRRVNLEHSAASLPNLLQAALLLTLLGLVLLTVTGPDVSLAGVHPMSVGIVAAYLYGTRLAGRAHRSPMWRPQETAETILDTPESDRGGERTRTLWVRFGLLAALMAAAGWAVGQGGLSLARSTQFTSSEVATLLTGVVTSFPELVVLVAAVRMGAPTLGVANIIGGNAFDTLFVPVADLFYREGSVYHAVTAQTQFVLALALVLTAVLSTGLLSRQQRGIGFEGPAIAVLYLGGMVTLVAGM